MIKLRYDTDPHNRVIIKNGGRRTPLPRFRYVIEGTFRIGEGNSLLYHVKAPVQVGRNITLPHQLKFKGTWSLTKDHDLKLTLNKWRRQTIGDEITLQGEIIHVDAYSLAFAVTQRTEAGAYITNILRLRGWWQADRDNRITFRVAKGQGRSDELVFGGIWEVKRRHRLAYTYKRYRTARGLKRHTVKFRGYWRMMRRNVLTYQMAYGNAAAFNFRVGTGIVRRNNITFDVGIGRSKRGRPSRKSVVLYGNWRIVKGSWLFFDIEYDKGVIRAMKFGAYATIFGNNKIRFVLKNEAGKNLGITFTLSKRFLGNGKTFMKFLYGKKEKAVYIGAGFEW